MGKQYERHKKHFIPHCALMTVKATASVRGGVYLALRFFLIFEPEPQILK